MIVWRGWGILAFLMFGLTVGLGALLASMTGTDMDGMTWQGIVACVIGAAATYYLGNYLNVVRPQQKFAEARAEAYGLVETGPDGVARPLALDQQPELSEDERVAFKGWRNRHTLFFIPMQWWSVLIVGWGLTMTFATLGN
ncbi:MAG: hypothetical protein ACTH1Z_07860 [Ancrocorticia sp.]|uniref:hypothetical protein n=1 Tax=Ancrocorticia sp. TaxID=2593684 RepID=UPI003F9392BC